MRGDFSNMGNDVRIRTDNFFYDSNISEEKNTAPTTLPNQSTTENNNTSNISKFNKTSYSRFRNKNKDNDNIFDNTNENSKSDGSNLTNPNIKQHYIQ